MELDAEDEQELQRALEVDSQQAQRPEQIVVSGLRLQQPAGTTTGGGTAATGGGRRALGFRWAASGGNALLLYGTVAGGPHRAPPPPGATAATLVSSDPQQQQPQPQPQQLQLVDRVRRGQQRVRQLWAAVPVNGGGVGRELNAAINELAHDCAALQRQLPMLLPMPTGNHSGSSGGGGVSVPEQQQQAAVQAIDAAWGALRELPRKLRLSLAAAAVSSSSSSVSSSDTDARRPFFDAGADSLLVAALDAVTRALVAVQASLQLQQPQQLRPPLVVSAAGPSVAAAAAAAAGVLHWALPPGAVGVQLACKAHANFVELQQLPQPASMSMSIRRPPPAALIKRSEAYQGFLIDQVLTLRRESASGQAQQQQHQKPEASAAAAAAVGDDGLGSVVSRDDLANQTGVAYAVWHLAHVMFVVPDSVPLLPLLTAWLNAHFADPRTTDAALLESDGVGGGGGRGGQAQEQQQQQQQQQREASSSSSSYWQALCGLACAGRLDTLHAVLVRHAAFRSAHRPGPALRSLAALLERRPPPDASDSVRLHWHRLARQVADSIGAGALGSWDERRLAAVLAGEADALLHTTDSLYSLLVSHLLFVPLEGGGGGVDSLRSALPYVLSRLLPHYPQQTPLDRILIACMRRRAAEVVERCRGLYGGAFVAAHLADVLHHAGWLEPEPIPGGDGETLRERLLEEYASSLLTRPGGPGVPAAPWALACSYLRQCPTRGARLLASVLERQPLPTTQRALLKLLHAARLAQEAFPDDPVLKQLPTQWHAAAAIRARNDDSGGNAVVGRNAAGAAAAVPRSLLHAACAPPATRAALLDRALRLVAAVDDPPRQQPPPPTAAAAAVPPSAAADGAVPMATDSSEESWLRQETQQPQQQLQHEEEQEREAAARAAALAADIIDVLGPLEQLQPHHQQLEQLPHDSLTLLRAWAATYDNSTSSNGDRGQQQQQQQQHGQQQHAGRMRLRLALLRATADAPSASRSQQQLRDALFYRLLHCLEVAAARGNKFDANGALELQAMFAAGLVGSSSSSTADGSSSNDGTGTGTDRRQLRPVQQQHQDYHLHDTGARLARLTAQYFLQQHNSSHTAVSATG